MAAAKQVIKAYKSSSSVVVVVVLLTVLVSSSSSAIPSKRLKSLNQIKLLNNKGPYIGLITVYSREEIAFFKTRAFTPDPLHPFVDLSGRRFRVGKIHRKRVIYVRCGVGMVNAAATTQQMLDVFDIVGIIHFGISGNANDSMSIGDVSIPKQFAETGLWSWLKSNGTLGSEYVAHMDIGEYNVGAAQGEGGMDNLLGRIGFRYENFYSETGTPNTPQQLLWAQVTQDWLHLASSLEGMELERCVNSSLCLPKKPKVVVGLKGSTANIFIDNAAYRQFLFNTFHVSSLDMESSAVVMTSNSNGYPVIVIRGMSDLAGSQTGNNTIGVYGSLAALNVANVVSQFIKILQAPAPSKTNFQSEFTIPNI